MTLSDLIFITPPSANVEIGLYDVDENDKSFFDTLYYGLSLYYPRNLNDCEVKWVAAVESGTLRIIL